MRLNGHQSQSGNYFRKFAEHYLDLFHPGEMANSLNVEILFGNWPSTISMYIFLTIFSAAFHISWRTLEWIPSAPTTILWEKATEEWSIIYFFYKTL